MRVGDSIVLDGMTWIGQKRNSARCVGFGDRMCWNVPWGVRRMPKRREIDDDDVERSRFAMGEYRIVLLQR